jgi:hypothetical protein
MGWIQTLAKVAANPPHAKGSNAFATALGVFSCVAVVIFVVAIVEVMFVTNRSKDSVSVGNQKRLGGCNHKNAGMMENSHLSMREKAKTITSCYVIFVLMRFID